MLSNTEVFDERHAIEHLRHYLPAQAALKDFVHHNTLHAFQNEPFHQALWKASQTFGYATYLSLDEYRSHLASGRISEQVLHAELRNYLHIVSETPPSDSGIEEWKNRLLHNQYAKPIRAKVGELRSYWKKKFGIQLNKSVHPILFRLLSSFLDQGISTWKFPVQGNGFLDALRQLESNGYVSFFRTKRMREELLAGGDSITPLLEKIVGKEEWFEQYLFDQQFQHPGWSGFVAVAEHKKDTLLKHRKISLHELIYLELILEADALEDKFGPDWQPLSSLVSENIQPLFEESKPEELSAVLSIWQNAFERSYYDQVLCGVQCAPLNPQKKQKVSFQSLFCIDDRSYSFRRHIQSLDEHCETYGTPGFFGVEFYFQPEEGRFYTKACPEPVNPKYLIKEFSRKLSRKKDLHYSVYSHSLVSGWLVSNTLGIWSAFKLLFNVFSPSVGAGTAFSFHHMDAGSRLQIDYAGEKEGDLQLGFKEEEMADRVQNLLKSIGLTQNFADLVYVVGHGGSSMNNTYYAGYDCGACCGRPGAVNARVFAYMANKHEVREILSERGIRIPDSTIFIGAMHDTTRDEIEFYDDAISNQALIEKHRRNVAVFQKALQKNASERSLRFDTMLRNVSNEELHNKVKRRSVSLFEPRPEWNHSDNALCFIGRRNLYSHLYLDKRPFINSYDYTQDSEGELLLNILKAAVPVCGGINLEYYFSRVDQLKLGAGSKLPHNVVGLFAVNTGVDGDLRSGLPSQMIEIHDPVRILFIVEHYPEVVLKVIQSEPAVYDWIKNHWVLFSVRHPEDGSILFFEDGRFRPYEILTKGLGEFKKESPALKNTPLLIQTPVY